MSDVARAVTLETQVDTTGARAGFNEIQREAGTMAAAVARSSEQAERATNGIGSGASGSARNVEAATRNLIGSIQRTSAAMETGSRTGSAYFEVLGRQRGIDPAVLEPYLAQLRAVEQAQHRGAAAANANAQATGHAGLSAAQINQELRFLPNRFQSIADSITAGQRPMQILIQQGGELVSSFGGISTAAKAVGGYLIGLVNPITITAAVVGTLALAYRQGTQELDAYARTLVLTGNAAGVTAGAMGDMAKHIATGFVTQREASAALAALLGTTKVSGENLQEFGRVTVAINREVGKSVEDIAKDFEALAKSPLQASVKLSEQYHYLTTATREQIDALEKQGKAEEAGETAQKAYAAAFEGRTQQLKNNIGDIERAWRGVGSVAQKAWDQMLNIGRPKSNEDQIADIDAQLERARTHRTPIVSFARLAVEQSKPGLDVDTLRRQRADLVWKKAKADWDAQQKGIEIQMSEAMQAWDQAGEKFLSRTKQRDNEIARMRTQGLAAGVSDKDMSDREAKIRQSYADLDNSDLAKLEANRTKQRAVLDGEMQDLENSRKLQLLSASEYYARKRDIDLKALALDLPILQATMGKDKKKEDQSAYQKDLGDLQAYFTRRSNIIKAANNSIAEEADGPAKALRAQVATWDRSISSQQQYADQEMKLFGQTDAARSILIAQLRIEADARKYLDDLKLKGHAPTEQEIADINREATAAKGRIANEIARTNAIAGAGQLREENRRSALEGISDAARYSDMALEIDAKKWRELISYAKEGSDERKLIEKEFNEWYANRQAERDPWTAARRTLAQYGREASDVGAGISQAMTNGFRSAEDALVSFITTGKLSFSSLASSIIADLARIEARKAISNLGSYALDFAMQSFGQIGSSQIEASHTSEMSRILSQLPARANGGPVNSGLSYLVGERGPEIFTPSSSGAITPNHLIGAGSGGGVTINLSTTVNNNGATSTAGGDQSVAGKALAEGLNAKIKAVLAGEMRQGGLIWKAQQGRG